MLTDQVSGTRGNKEQSDITGEIKINVDYIK